MHAALAATAALAAAGAAVEARAWPGQRPAQAPPQVSNDRLDQIQRALDEKRFVDAGELIDQLTLAGAADPRLSLMAGELGLARGRYEAAIQAFRLARSTAVASQAREGEALALTQLGRGREALPLLRQVVNENPKAWRAWNALGVESDKAQAWSDAEQAYAHALAAAPDPAVTLNNRGYSRLLQGRLDAAVADFVAALGARPDLTEARANLRLALALRGDYDRAVDGADDQDRAALLNNAGLAAGARGDFAQAETLLKKAMEVNGQFYPRAAENLALVRTLASRTEGDADVPR